MADLLKWISPIANKGYRDFWLGTPDQLKKIDTGTEEQKALHNQILAQAMGMSQQGGGYNLANQYYNNLLGGNQQQAFDQFSQPYLQQFQEQMLPEIAERFAGGGALSSSGFGQAVGGAASGLQSQLAQLFSQLQSQAAGQQYGQYNQLAQTGLGHQQFAYQHIPGSQGFLGTALGAAGAAFGGPVGAAAGNAVGTGISNLFKSKQAGGIT